MRENAVLSADSVLVGERLVGVLPALKTQLYVLFHFEVAALVAESEHAAGEETNATGSASAPRWTTTEFYFMESTEIYTSWPFVRMASACTFMPGCGTVKPTPLAEDRMPALRLATALLGSVRFVTTLASGPIALRPSKARKRRQHETRRIRSKGDPFFREGLSVFHPETRGTFFLLLSSVIGKNRRFS